MKITVILIVLISQYNCFGQSKVNFTDSNGLKQSIWKEYHKNGNIKTIANYKNDTLDSTYTSFYSNGKIEFTSFFEKGVKNGESKYYDEKGQLKGLIISDKGKWLKIVKFNKGKEIYKEIYKDNVSVEIWMNGKLSWKKR